MFSFFHGHNLFSSGKEANPNFTLKISQVFTCQNYRTYFASLIFLEERAAHLIVCELGSISATLLHHTVSRH